MASNALLESGDFLLLEDGDNLLLENDVIDAFVTFPAAAAMTDSAAVDWTGALSLPTTVAMAQTAALDYAVALTIPAISNATFSDKENRQLYITLTHTLPLYSIVLEQLIGGPDAPGATGA